MSAELPDLNSGNKENKDKNLRRVETLEDKNKDQAEGKNKISGNRAEDFGEEQQTQTGEKKGSENESGEERDPIANKSSDGGSSAAFGKDILQKLFKQDKKANLDEPEQKVTNWSAKDEIPQETRKDLSLLLTKKKTLATQSNDRLVFGESLLDQQAGRLSSSGLMIVTSHHYHTALSAAFCVQGDSQWLEIPRYRLDLRSVELGGIELWHFYETDDLPDHFMLHLVLDNEAAGQLIKPVLHDEFEAKNPVKQSENRERERRLLLQAPISALRTIRADSEGAAEQIPVWEVNYVPYLLAQRGLDKKKDCEIVALLQDQISKGRWGKSDAEICRRLAICQDIRLEIGRLSDSPGLKPRLELVQEKDEPTGLACLELYDRGLLERYLFFVATYFPGLSFEEFTLVLERLIENEEVEQPEQPPAVEEPDSESKQDYWVVSHTLEEERVENSKAEVPKKSLSLSEVWFERSETIFDEIPIQISEDEDDHEIVEFENPGLRESFEQFFLKRRRPFLMKCIEILKNSMIFFSDSTRTRDHIIDLMVNMSKRNSDFYGHGWLKELVFHMFLEQLEKTEEAFGSEMDLAACFKQLKEAKENLVMLNWIARIIRKMTPHAVLRPMIDKFFNQLIDDEDSRDMALTIIRKLKGAIGFDEYRWIKQLINRGGFTIRDDIEEYFVEFVRRNASNPQKVFDTFDSWLPKERKTNLSNSEQFAGLLLMRTLLVHSKVVYFQFLRDEPETRLALVQRVAEILYNPASLWLLENEPESVVNLLVEQVFFTPSLSSQEEFASLLSVRNDFDGFWGYFQSEIAGILNRRPRLGRLSPPQILLTVLTWYWSFLSSGGNLACQEGQDAQCLEVWRTSLSTYLAGTGGSVRATAAVWRLLADVLREFRDNIQYIVGDSERENRKFFRALEREYKDRCKSLHQMRISFQKIT